MARRDRRACWADRPSLVRRARVGKECSDDDDDDDDDVDDDDCSVASMTLLFNPSATRTAEIISCVSKGVRKPNDPPAMESMGGEGP